MIYYNAGLSRRKDDNDMVWKAVRTTAAETSFRGRQQDVGVACCHWNTWRGRVQPHPDDGGGDAGGSGSDSTSGCGDQVAGGSHIPRGADAAVAHAAGGAELTGYSQMGAGR